MMSSNITALVTDIQRFCMHDGPGVRTTVFFKGCPLKCKWCHNPETKRHSAELMFIGKKCVQCMACQNVCPQNAQLFGEERSIDREKCTVCGKCTNVCPTGALNVSGKEMSVSEIMDEVMRDAAFYGKDGGITVSGGEPTAQKDALLSLLSMAKGKGITTCLETCGVFDPSLTDALAPLTDTVLYDIKDTDEARLYDNTGASLSLVVSNLRRLDTLGVKTVLRCIMIPRVNMTDAHADALAGLYMSLKNAACIELLPYHPYGSSKSEQLGEKAVLYDVPQKEALTAFASHLKENGVPVKLHGTVI